MNRSDYISKNIINGDYKQNPPFSMRLDVKDLASIARYFESIDIRINTKSQLVQSAIAFLAQTIEDTKDVPRHSTDIQALEYMEDELHIPLITNKQQEDVIKKKTRNEKFEIGRGQVSEQSKTIATAFHMREQQIANNFQGTAKEFEQRMYELIDNSPIEWEEYVTLYPTREFDDFIGAGRDTETQKQPTPKITPSAPDAPDLSPDTLRANMDAEKDSVNTNDASHEKNVHENEQTPDKQEEN